MALRKICVEVTRTQPSTTRSPWTYTTGRLRADLARAKQLGTQKFMALNGPEVEEAEKTCNMLQEELRRFYANRHSAPLLFEPRDHPVRSLFDEPWRLFTGSHYQNYKAGQKFVEPRSNWPAKNQILQAGLRFLEADEAEVEAEFQAMLAASANWYARVRAYMDQIIAAEKAKEAQEQAERLLELTERAVHVRSCLRDGLTPPRFDLRPLRQHNLLSAAEIAAVEAAREAESREYWFDLYEKGELPEGIVPYTPNWDDWLDSRDYDRWEREFNFRRDIAWVKENREAWEADRPGGDPLTRFEEKLTAAHDKRLRQRFKRLGKNCRTRNK